MNCLKPFDDLQFWQLSYIRSVSRYLKTTDKYVLCIEIHINTTSALPSNSVDSVTIKRYQLLRLITSSIFSGLNI